MLIDHFSLEFTVKMHKFSFLLGKLEIQQKTINIIIICKIFLQLSVCTVLGDKSSNKLVLCCQYFCLRTSTLYIDKYVLVIFTVKQIFYRYIRNVFQ